MALLWPSIADNVGGIDALITRFAERRACEGTPVRGVKDRPAMLPAHPLGRAVSNQIFRLSYAQCSSACLCFLRQYRSSFAQPAVI